MLNIEPIRLLSGSHEDTAQTGSGCFMNVIAYLNGEPQITDESPCVDPVIRRIAIWVNDWMSDDERHALIPFIHRAMGTATEDHAIISMRLDAVVRMVKDMAFMAREFADADADAHAAATNAAAHAAATNAATNAHAANANAAADAAAHAAAYAAAYAASAAAYAAAYAANANAYKANRQRIIDRVIQFMDEACPPADIPTQVLIERANRLVELAGG